MLSCAALLKHYGMLWHIRRWTVQLLAPQCVLPVLILRVTGAHEPEPSSVSCQCSSFVSQALINLNSLPVPQ
jgi:hypothetical protein